MNTEIPAAQEPPPLDRVIVFLPTKEGIDVLEYPSERVASVGYNAETGAFQLIVIGDDGHPERFINVAARIIHKVPSRIYSVPAGARV